VPVLEYLDESDEAISIRGEVAKLVAKFGRRFRRECRGTVRNRAQRLL
jgi:hypothetical protein